MATVAHLQYVSPFQTATPFQGIPGFIIEKNSIFFQVEESKKGKVDRSNFDLLISSIAQQP